MEHVVAWKAHEIFHAFLWALAKAMQSEEAVETPEIENQAAEAPCCGVQ